MSHLSEPPFVVTSFNGSPAPLQEFILDHQLSESKVSTWKMLSQDLLWHRNMLVKLKCKWLNSRHKKQDLGWIAYQAGGFLDSSLYLLTGQYRVQCLFSWSSNCSSCCGNLTWRTIRHVTTHDQHLVGSLGQLPQLEFHWHKCWIRYWPWCCFWNVTYLHPHYPKLYITTLHVTICFQILNSFHINYGPVCLPVTFK